MNLSKPAITMLKQHYHSSARPSFFRSKILFSVFKRSPPAITKDHSAQVFRNKKTSFGGLASVKKNKQYSKAKDRRAALGTNATGRLRFFLRLRPRFKTKRLVYLNNNAVRLQQLFFRAQSRRCRRLFQSLNSGSTVKD